MNTNENGSNNTIKSKVLEKIRSGKVKMHCHSYFAAKTTLLVLGLVLVLLVTVFAASFLMFILNSNGLILLPAFGMAGIARLLLLFPWTILALLLLFIFLMDFSVRRFAFAYHQPIMYSALTVFVLVLVFGIALAQTPLHDRLAMLSKGRSMPLMTGLYQGYGEGHSRGLFVGSVSEVQEDMMMVDDMEGEQMPVRLGPDTVLPAGWNFHVNDPVMIICPGKCAKNMEAVGIKKLKDHDFEMFEHFRGSIMHMKGESKE